VKANVLFFDRKPAAADAVDDRDVDLRPAHQHALHAQGQPDAGSGSRRLRRGLLPGRRGRNAVESERFRRFGYDELVGRDKANLDITWLRDESRSTMQAPCRAPGVLAAEIVEELEAALAQFSELAASLPVELDQLSEPRRAVP
jgi:type I restriction enzyme M protein